MSSGERPIGAAKGKQSDTEALCQPPPPPSRAPSLCPATVTLTPSAGFNGICNRRYPPPHCFGNLLRPPVPPLLGPALRSLPS